MKQNNIEREEAIKQLENEKHQEAVKKRKAKEDVMKMFDAEYLAKKQFNDQNKVLQKHMPDWGKNNVFTHVYETKEH